MQEMIVGENTYVTLAEADEYVETVYGAYSPLRVIWSILTDEEKYMYLQNSLYEIESMPIVGQRYRANQNLQFPRIKHGVSYGRTAYFALPRLDVIPAEVKDAQVENALGIIEKECSNRANIQFKALQTFGAIKNVKYNKRDISDAMLGDIMQPIGGGESYLTSADAEKLMRPWFGTFRG